MKVKVISRDDEQYVRSTKEDLQKVQTNTDPTLHPLEAAREYKRALNAVKLERVFAKPFVASLDGHRDGVVSFAKHPTRLNTVASGACDGEVRLWNLTSRKCIYSAIHHRGFVRGLCMTPRGQQLISVGEDKTIRITKLSQIGEEINPDADAVEAPITIVHKTFFTGVDHHRRQDLFATSGSVVAVWSQDRSEPLQSYSWGADTVNTVKFNPVEINVLASTGDDRNICLYDVRARSPIRKVVLEMKTNAICWNPIEAFNFIAANEDHNCYTFDMRDLSRALNVHKDHVSAVMDVDFAPTGREFVTASYDRSIRIFGFDQGHSREVYHTKRMQRLFTVAWSADNKYILSGSDEMNIRLWKATAWEALGTKAPRQAAALNYASKLKERFKHHPEVRRIARHRHVPKEIYKAKEEKRIMETSAKRKEDNRRKHSKPGSVPFKQERKKHVVREEE